MVVLTAEQIQADRTAYIDQYKKYPYTGQEIPKLALQDVMSEGNVALREAHRNALFFQSFILADAQDQVFSGSDRPQDTINQLGDLYSRVNATGRVLGEARAKGRDLANLFYDKCVDECTARKVNLEAGRRADTAVRTL